ncbi:hypothetical protein M8C21_019308, partial [Ambrosia artemisiifolia]
MILSLFAGLTVPGNFRSILPDSDENRVLLYVQSIGSFDARHTTRTVIHILCHIEANMHMYTQYDTKHEFYIY